MCTLTLVDTYTQTHTVTSNSVVFLRGVYVKEVGSWNSLHTSNLWSLTADMIAARSKEEKALTFSYGSYYLHHFLSVFIFTSSSNPPLSHSDFLLHVFQSFNFSSKFLPCCFCLSVCLHKQHACVSDARCKLCLCRHRNHKWGEQNTHTHIREHL